MSERLSLVQLAQSAAHATGCRVGMFLTGIGDCFTVIASFGLDPANETVLNSPVLARVATARTGGVLILDVAASVRPDVAAWWLPLFGQQLVPRFIAAVRLMVPDAITCGLLIVADPKPRPGLSAAASYVLLTHAAQVTSLLELDALRRPSGRGEPPIPGASHQRAMERLRLLVSLVVNAHDAVLITDAGPIDHPGPSIVYANAAFTRTTGYEEAEILGLTPRLLQAPTTDRAALDRLRLALARWEPVEVELFNLRKDGSGFWVELSIAPVANERGWFTHWVSVQREISDRKNAEESVVRVRIAEAENMVLEKEIKERRRIQAQLTFAAFHDDLTKLSNRAFFMQALATALDRVVLDPSCRVAVLFLDLDRFKLINDSMGHQAGDLLLIEVAHRLRNCIRPQDTLGRIGGDEFAVLVETGDDTSEACELAERIIETMRRPIWLGRQEIFSSISVGLVQATAQYRSPEELMRDADIAMYRAKRNDPGSYMVFTGSMRSEAIDKLVLQTDLRNAVARGQFVLHYQPICSAENGAVLGLEALIRWQHPQRGLVAPGDFIGNAEEIGEIGRIGHWVLKQACTRMRRWHERLPALRLSVNVSGAELRYANFGAGVQKVLAETGFDPDLLQIEITEGVFLHQPDRIDAILGEIRALGVRVALDDFGTGYSSLGHLDRYTLNAIKIDQSFVMRMLTQPSTMAIIDAIITLGRALDVEIVAEGVETETQLAALRGAGCRFVQGYLFGRPMTEEAVEQMLEAKAAII